MNDKPPPKPLVLLIDDDAELSEMAKELLVQHGFVVHSAATWQAAQLAMKHMKPDLLLLDVMLPDGNGFDICRRWRSDGNSTAILMLTALGAPMDRVLGLELGADDYIAKPFEPLELVARIRALLRRTLGMPASTAPAILEFGKLSIDLVAMRVCCGQSTVALSSLEFKMLAALASQAGKPMSREALCLAVQPGQYQPLLRAVDVQAARLRKKMLLAFGEHDWIKTVRGVGYVFTGR
jgi:DNA-binding response OmpR family regulator